MNIILSDLKRIVFDGMVGSPSQPSAEINLNNCMTKYGFLYPYLGTWNVVRALDIVDDLFKMSLKEKDYYFGSRNYFCYHVDWEGRHSIVSFTHHGNNGEAWSIDFLPVLKSDRIVVFTEEIEDVERFINDEIKPTTNFKQVGDLIFKCTSNKIMKPIMVSTESIVESRMGQDKLFIPAVFLK